MKLKNGFILREVAGSMVVVPLDPTHTFGNMLKLNGTGKFLWELLGEDVTEDDLVSALISEYEIDRETAARDTERFLTALRTLDALEN